MTEELRDGLGGAVERIDGVAKVTGAARYASDEPVTNPAFGYMLVSQIARGSIRAIDVTEATAVPGVIDIVTHENVGSGFKPAKGPDGGPTTTTLESDRIWHDGQFIGLVVAESIEAAREAANKVKISYAAETPAATFDASGAETEPHKPQRGEDPKKGDAAAAFASAAAKISEHYSTPTQHHNPIELFSVTCAWEADRLTIYEPSQFMWGTKASAAMQLDISPDNVRAVSRYVGGAFGSKGPNPRTHWIARIARKIGRPVKVVPTRDQGFTIATYRAETRQHVQLGAASDGRLVSFFHEGWEVTSRPSPYNVSGVESTARMYACPNIHTAVNVVHADRNTPGYMRAPPETPYMFALESAMDELAHALHMDPIELRRVNDTALDPVSGHPFSSRSLMRCYDEAAAKFEWTRRNPIPGKVSEGDWLVGLGCATACYPSNLGPAAVRVSLNADGQVTVGLAGHEIGTGAYTTVAVIAAQSLGLPVEAITVSLGDSDLPPIMIAGGSNNAASASLVVAKACEQIRGQLARAAAGARTSVFHGKDAAQLRLQGGKLTGFGHEEALREAVVRVGYRVEVYAENVPPGLPSDAVSSMTRGKPAMLSGSSRADVTAYAFGAHFVEVRVHRLTREIRVPRTVSAFAAGTIINSKTAYSQFMGGAIWGLSSALFEATDIDPQSARYINKNLADYLIPVNADTPSVEILMIPERDERVNALGIKGIGEIGIVGMNAAVANAVFNATGIRVRDLPIRAEKLLSAPYSLFS
jgi:xanthine dehydrogenase YagR molybdenum-binding subunit